LAAAVAGVLVLAAALAGGALWVVSEQAAVERMAEVDLQEMADRRKESKWPESRAALGRAKARLGDRGSADLHRRIDRAEVELTLIARLDAARLTGSWTTGGVPSHARADDEFESALRDAGVWLPGDDPEVVARRIRASDVSAALVNALDGWADLTRDAARRELLLQITRIADPDPGGWRSQARDPAVWANKAALERVAEAAPVAELRVPLFLLFAERCRRAGIDPSDMLRKVHSTQPSDFWLSLRLGEYAYNRRRFFEATRFFQAAVVLRPDAAVAHSDLGLSLANIVDWRKEALVPLLEAKRLDPDAPEIRKNLALVLETRGDHAGVIEHVRFALQSEPSSVTLHVMLARNLEAQKKDDEALAEYRRAVECDGRNQEAQMGLRTIPIRRGQAKEVIAAWKEALASDPPDHDAWYGYAELCLYLGHEDEYRTARSKLLARFANEASPGVAERVSRACLLRPAEGAELKQAAILANRAAAADRTKVGAAFAHFQFAQGLADFRQGQLDRAIAAMRGEASKVLGPAPKLVLAMALFQKGEVAEARKVIAAAIAGHDWSPANVRDQDGWIYHSLRREAEAMIPFDPPTKR
jgi:serine/threonine-protein kinase